MVVWSRSLGPHPPDHQGDKSLYILRWCASPFLKQRGNHWVKFSYLFNFSCTTQVCEKWQNWENTEEMELWPIYIFKKKVQNIPVVIVLSSMTDINKYIAYYQCFYTTFTCQPAHYWPLFDFILQLIIYVEYPPHPTLLYFYNYVRRSAVVSYTGVNHFALVAKQKWSLKSDFLCLNRGPEATLSLGLVLFIHRWGEDSSLPIILTRVSFFAMREQGWEEGEEWDPRSRLTSCCTPH